MFEDLHNISRYVARLSIRLIDPREKISFVEKCSYILHFRAHQHPTLVRQTVESRSGTAAHSETRGKGMFVRHSLLKA